MFYVKTFAWRRHLMQYIKLCKLATQVTKPLLNCFGVHSYWTPKQDTMVRTPRPGWPIIIPHALRYSISLEAFDLSPIFSLSRWILKPAFFRPSGRQRGTTKHDTPSLLWARVKKASLIGAEVNHLWPINQKASPEAKLGLLGWRQRDPNKKGVRCWEGTSEIINEAATTTRSTTRRKTKMTRTYGVGRASFTVKWL